MKHFGLIASAIVMSLTAAGPRAVDAAEQSLDPKAITITLPDQIPWKRNAAGTTEAAVLVGDPAKPGLYVQMFKWLPGNMSRPHWHPNDRYITVLKGTWWVGTGNTFDPDHTVPLPTGTYVTHYGKEVHYDGAKDAEVVLLVVGEGPETATLVTTAPPPAH
jgi:quercetin dioxygenase-like cupin family protein